MFTSNHLLSDLWEKYRDVLTPDITLTDVANLTQSLTLAHLVSVGDFYYYFLDLSNGNLINPSEKINTLHQWKEHPKNVQEIMNLIHPDDTEFVIEAEKWILKKLKTLDASQLPLYKASYCFRMLNQDKEYNLFHHQAFLLIEHNTKKVTKAINIHTNIQNLTQNNNYNVTIGNMGNEKEVYKHHYHKNLVPNLGFQKLTQREREILQLLMCGKTDKEIALQLYISFYTARTHHKNILRKIEAKNTTELFKLCIENGYL